MKDNNLIQQLLGQLKDSGKLVDAGVDNLAKRIHGLAEGEEEEMESEELEEFAEGDKIEFPKEDADIKALLSIFTKGKK